MQVWGDVVTDFRHQAPLKQCAQPGCTASFRDHRWGATKAHDEGWFLQQNGDAWCPEHVPDWVAQWRKKQQRKET